MSCSLFFCYNPDTNYGDRQSFLIDLLNKFKAQLIYISWLDNWHFHLTLRLIVTDEGIGDPMVSCLNITFVVYKSVLPPGKVV